VIPSKLKVSKSLTFSPNSTLEWFLQEMMPDQVTELHTITHYMDTLVAKPDGIAMPGRLETNLDQVTELHMTAHYVRTSVA
jgi:hypothetical protein